MGPPPPSPLGPSRFEFSKPGLQFSVEAGCDRDRLAPHTAAARLGRWTADVLDCDLRAPAAREDPADSFCAGTAL